MAFPANGTKLANLFDPEVVGAMLEKKLYDDIKFTPIADVDTTLVGRPGSTLTLPFFNKLGGAAIDVAEGVDITINQLTESTVTATVKKIGTGFQITDEAMLSGYGDAMGNAISQMSKQLATKIDNDLLAELANATLKASKGGTSFVPDDVADALVLFGEDIQNDAVLFVSPAVYAILRKSALWIPNTEVGASIIMSGVVGSIYGCQVVVSNKITNKLYIVRRGALKLIMKRGANVETDRDIINKSSVVTADVHYIAYFADATKAIELSI